MADVYNGPLEFNDDWGAVEREGGIPASGQAVQEFIKRTFEQSNDIINSKIGYLFSVDDTGSNRVLLLGFLTEEYYNEWLAAYPSTESQLTDGVNDERVILNTIIPKAEKTESTYAVSLNNKTTNKAGSIVDTIVSTDNTIKIKFLFDSIEYPVTGDPVSTGESGTLAMGTRKSNSEAWVDIPTSDIEKYIPNYNKILSGTETEIDITNLLKDGYQEFRMQVMGNGDGSGVGKKTSYIIYKLTKTNLSVVFKNDWEKPLYKSMILDFNVYGQDVDKYLHIKISGAGGSGYKEETRYIGPASIADEYSYTITSLTSDNYKVNTHGIHNIEYWVTVGNTGDENEITTDHSFAQIMMATDLTNENPYIIVNNIKSQLTNWTQETLFEYAIYTNLNTYPLTMVLRDSNDSVDYLRFAAEMITPGVRYSAMSSLEVEADGDKLPAKLYFINSETDESLRDPIQFYINNVGDYVPTSGADFILNPKSKSNTDGSPETIINAATGEEVVYIDEDGQTIKSEWSGFNYNDTDGWIYDEEGVRCLRILSGQTLSIPYHPFSGVTKNSCTIEMSIAVRNIINESNPILTIGNYNTVTNDDGNETTMLQGFELRPLSAVFMNNEDVNSQGIRDNRDIMYAEDTKTHITINIYHGLYAAGDDFPLQYLNYLPEGVDINTKVNKNINMVRIYVNGRINREFSYSDAMCDEFEDTLNRTLLLGNINGGADLDVYSIRVYKKQLNSANILKDYISSLPKIEDKDKELRDNDILDDTTKSYIKYDKVVDKYNTLLWKYNTNNPYTRLNGREFGDKEKKNGLSCDLIVKLGNRDKNGNFVLDKDCSGIINNMSTEGQGTSSMTYWKWNQRFKFEDDSVFTTENGETLSGCYRLNFDDPLIKRLDGKINWASSMQSHKIGSTALYNDLWKTVIGGNMMTALNSVESFEALHESNKGGKTAEELFNESCEFTGREDGYASCRVCVHQEPFMMFWQPQEGAEPIFYGLYTWGASKGDKPTFGYNKGFNKNFVMIEGTDNDRALVMHRVPWDDVHVTQRFVDGEVNGGNIYNTYEQWEVSMGNGETAAVGEHWDQNPCLVKFKEMCNFVYLLNPHIHPFNGNFTDLCESYTTDPNSFIINDFYWINKDEGDGAHMKYDLYRFDEITKEWVNAGLYNIETSGFDRLNLQDQTGATIEDLSGNIDENNSMFISKRAALFKAGISQYVHVDDLLFTMQFLKLIAASDNWGKNTYIYNTGLIDANGNLDNFRFFQDDLDTIFEIDNSGLKTKPYYVEEHDTNAEGKPFWNSSNNALYCLAEIAFEVESRSMMNNMLSSMSALKKAGSPERCFEMYYQDKAQNYFPAVAYNEIAKLLYEDGEARDENPPSVNPLAQSLGDQTQAERQWQKSRCAYISSYASYGVFGAMGGAGATGAFILRSAAADYDFELIPHIWMYPSCALGSSSVNYGGGSVPKRAKAGDLVNISIKNPGNDTQCIIRGVNHMRSIGDFSQHQVNPSHTINLFGERLTEFTVTGTPSQPILFAPSEFRISNSAEMNSLKRFIISGNTSKDIITSSLDLSTLWRLEEVDVTATKVTSVKLPVNSNIYKLHLPSSIQSLSLDNLARLTDFNIRGYRNLTSITIYDTNIDSLSLIRSCISAKSELTNLDINNINWTDVTLDELHYLLKIDKCNLIGKITIKSGEVIGFDDKMSLLSKFGNIDDPQNGLYVIYDVIKSTDKKYISIKGESSVYHNGNYPYSLNYPSAMDSNISANDFYDIEWSVDNTTFGNINDTSGVFRFINVPEITDKEEKTINIYCTIYKMINGSPYSFTVTKKIYLYQLPANVGDYLYADGTYSSYEDYSGNKTIVGVCIYAEDTDEAENQKRVAAAIETVGSDRYPGVMWGMDSKLDEIEYDIPELVNYTYPFTTSWDGNMYITNSIAINVIKNLSSFDASLSVHDVDGKANTDIIIAYRDKVLDAKGRPSPNDWSDPMNMPNGNEYLYMTSLIDNTTTDANGIDQRMVYFPAASFCHAYQPGHKPGGVVLKEGEVLSENLTVGNWYLPSFNQAVHMWYYLTNKKSAFDTSVTLNSFKLYDSIGYEWIWTSTESGGFTDRAHSIEMGNSNRVQSGYTNWGTSSPCKTSENMSYAIPVVDF